MFPAAIGDNRHHVALEPSPEAAGDGSLGLRDETGGITCCLAAWQGDDDLASARRRLFNDLDRLGAVLNGRPPCDIPGLWRTNVTGLDLSQDQTEDGCLAMLVFRIEFSARLPGVGGMGGFA